MTHLYDYILKPPWSMYRRSMAALPPVARLSVAPMVTPRFVTIHSFSMTMLTRYDSQQMDWTDRHYRFMMRMITKETLLFTEMVVDQTVRERYCCKKCKVMGACEGV